MTKSDLFPLSVNSFPVLNLEKKQVQQCEETMSTLLRQLLQMDQHQQTDYKPRFSSHYRFTRDYYGSMDEVVHNLSAGTMSEVRRISALFHDDLLDAAILAKLPTAKHNFLAIKWSAHELIPIVKNRDNLFLQSTGFTQDLNGETVGYYITDAIALPQWPELTHMGFARMNYQQLHLFRPSKKKHNHVETTIIGSMNTGVGLPQWLTKLIVMSVHKRINNFFSNLYKFQNLPQQGQLHVNLITHHRKECSICYQRFGMWRRRKFCCYCGESICRKCSVNRKVFGPNSDIQRSKVRLCKVCLNMNKDNSERSGGLNSSRRRLPEGYCDSVTGSDASHLRNSFETESEIDVAETYQPSRLVGEFELTHCQVFDFNKINDGIDEQKQLVDLLRWKSTQYSSSQDVESGTLN